MNTVLLCLCGYYQCIEKFVNYFIAQVKEAEAIENQMRAKGPGGPQPPQPGQQPQYPGELPFLLFCIEHPSTDNAQLFIYSC